jgi:outer membrane protein assembly factor BamA
VGGWTLEGQFRREPNEDFYGAGNVASVQDKSSFTLEEYRLRLQYRHRLRPTLRLELDLGYRANEIGAGRSRSAPSIYDRYTPEGLAGLGVRSDFATAVMALRSSRVDVPGSPKYGNRSLAKLSYAQSLGEDFSHFGLTLAGEQFWELFYRRTFSLRLGTEWRWAPGDQHLPFYALAALGGPEVLRGFRRGRLRDRGTVFVVGTYKFPVSRYLDATLFGETGQVLNTPGDFPLRQWHRAYGGSLRLWVPKGVIFEQNLVHSVEGYFLLFNFKTDF